MFTGLVEEMGTIERVEPRTEGRRFQVRAAAVLAGARVGDSVSVNGCCLTMIELGAPGFVVEAVPETLKRTTLGDLEAGHKVNLEAALRLDQRLGGHLVQGHVDGVGEVVSSVPEGEGRRVTVQVPAALARFVAEKGSIALDGVSLTIAAARGRRCEVALIPHTLAVTTAGAWAAGGRVNIEVDLLARYVARLMDEAGIEGRSV